MQPSRETCLYERRSQRGVDKQLRCCLLPVRIYLCMSKTSDDLAPITSQEFVKSSSQVFFFRFHITIFFLLLCNYQINLCSVHPEQIFFLLFFQLFLPFQHAQLQLCSKYGQTLDHAIHWPHATNPHGVHQLPPSKEAADANVSRWLGAEGKCVPVIALNNAGCAHVSHGCFFHRFMTC